MNFKGILDILWNLYVGGSNVNDVIQFLMFRRHFEYPEVCSVTTRFWFEIFSTNLYYPEFQAMTRTYRYFLCTIFITSIKSSYPSWTIDYYMDALKLPKQTVEMYMQEAITLETYLQHIH
ncbi:hypothetical protein M0802_014174 [Mischocyttarus mexicanus]|nr:hypothetical protein M0802_014313 [Mischocyttarus mexicanus]KAI4480483.1 hypothetical protein M0802_014174 [Mischocyttarus mexicanus]